MSGCDAVGLALEELVQLLRSTEPAALLVPPRILRRIIKQDRQAPGIGWQVPHRRSCVIDCSRLFQLVDRADLGLAPEVELPATLLLLKQPDAEALAAMSRQEALLKHWRLLFHVRVHQLLDQRTAAGQLTDPDVAARVQEIGAVEFEEVHSVLHQERMILPPDDVRSAYTEFVAVYLELRHFAPSLLRIYFPGITDRGHLDRVLVADIDSTSLFNATRLPGAADPRHAAEQEGEDRAEQTDDSGEMPSKPANRLPAPAKGLFQRFLDRGNRAADEGNLVRAARLNARAAAVAPPGYAALAQSEAQVLLQRLLRRLQAALKLKAVEAKRWRKLLPALLEPAARGLWPVEARLLYDLQRVCLDHERPVYHLGLVEWAISLGQRPIKQPLPGLESVLALKHLRRAMRRLSAARIGDAERRQLALLLQNAIHGQEERTRERFRFTIGAVLEDVGLHSASLPEQVARRKLIEELLDRIVERGFVTLGDLRDALSRNQLKLPDLSGFVEWLRGDQLLRANRRLAVQLDGVYHRGEVYLRWLQRLSSLAFGTSAGRFLMLYLVLPFAGAFVILKGVEEIIHLTARLLGAVPPPGVWVAAALGSTEGETVPPVARAGIHLVNWYSFTVLGIFLLAVLHVPSFRQSVGHALANALHGLRWTLVDFPLSIFRLPFVRRIIDSQPVRLGWQLLVKPFAIAALLSLCFPLLGAGLQTWLVGLGILFVATTVLLNSRLGRNLEESVSDRLARAWEQVHVDIVPGFFRLIVGFFKRATEGVELVLYTVDEWLRFRSGDHQLSMVVKLVLGVFWFFLTYFIRIFINLFVEPTFNPIKHFPVVTAAAKLIVPVIKPLDLTFTATFEPYVGAVFAGLIAALMIFFLPGLAGFIVWELKENWRLYRANRAATLRPALIGHHGETLRRLLRPGFHSGTIPKLFAKLRKAEHKARRGGSWRSFRHQQDALRHVQEALRHFVEREFLTLLEGSACWGAKGAKVGTVSLSTNAIRIELRRAETTATTATLVFTERGGLLQAAVVEPGWLLHLTPQQRRAVNLALLGLFQLGAVERIGEPPVAFPERAIAWTQWVETWEAAQEGKGLPETLLPDIHALPDQKMTTEVS